MPHRVAGIQRPQEAGIRSQMQALNPGALRLRETTCPVCTFLPAQVRCRVWKDRRAVLRKDYRWNDTESTCQSVP